MWFFVQRSSQCSKKDWRVILERSGKHIRYSFYIVKDTQEVFLVEIIIKTNNLHSIIDQIIKVFILKNIPKKSIDVKSF